MPLRLHEAGSLRARMTLGFTVWFAVVAALGCLCFSVWSRRLARNDVQERVNAAAQLVVREWTESALHPHHHRQWQAESGREEDLARDAAHAIGEAKEDLRLDGIALIALDRNGNILGTNQASHLSVDTMRRRAWITAEAPYGTARVVAGKDWQATETVLFRQTLLLALFSFLACGAGSIAAWFLVGSTLRPIGLLADEAKRAHSDPLRAHLHAPSQDAEVRHLVVTLNDFLERLQQNARTREQFYAAAAHELRTPLTVLSGNLELALSRPRTVPEYTDTLHELQRETRRLIALAESLLTLNRLQLSLASEDPERINLWEACEDIVATLQTEINARHLTVTRESMSRDAETDAPRSHVHMLLRNLIENAVKYTPARGNVRVAIDDTGAQIEVIVDNDFEAVDQIDFDRLDEPFFRSESSRATTVGGNGLGLAICRQLADNHNWPLRHAPRSGGIVATVAFPKAPSVLP